MEYLNIWLTPLDSTVLKANRGYSCAQENSKLSRWWSGTENSHPGCRNSVKALAGLLPLSSLSAPWKSLLLYTLLPYIYPIFKTVPRFLSILTQPFILVQIGFILLDYRRGNSKPRGTVKQGWVCTIQVWARNWVFPYHINIAYQNALDIYLSL